MAYIIIFACVGLLAAFAIFFWKQYGPGSGRAYGNRLAEHNGIKRKTFWYLLESGTKGSSLDLLRKLENSKTNLEQASVHIGPILKVGIERLEARFGQQGIYDEAKPIIAKLLESGK